MSLVHTGTGIFIFLIGTTILAVGYLAQYSHLIVPGTEFASAHMQQTGLVFAVVGIILWFAATAWERVR